jgi:hypothetical protein
MMQICLFVSVCLFVCLFCLFAYLFCLFVCFSGLNCPISDEDMMQVNQGNKTNPNTAGILGNTGIDPLRKKSGCQDEDSINEVLYAAQVVY